MNWGLLHFCPDSPITHTERQTAGRPHAVHRPEWTQQRVSKKDTQNSKQKHLLAMIEQEVEEELYVFC